MMSKEAMKLALEALEYIEHNYMSLPAPAEKAITALREALAEQPARPYRLLQDNGSKYFGESWDKAEQPAQQEPVAWPCLIAEADFSQDTVTLAMQCTDYKVSAGKHWLSNTPPAQRTWVGLTDEEIDDIDYANWSEDYQRWNIKKFARSIEAKLKEKNNG